MQNICRDFVFYLFFWIACTEKCFIYLNSYAKLELSVKVMNIPSFFCLICEYNQGYKSCLLWDYSHENYATSKLQFKSIRTDWPTKQLTNQPTDWILRVHTPPLPLNLMCGRTLTHKHLPCLNARHMHSKISIQRTI